jgi:transcriptional regulator of acetoin/glycerol metabolism
MERIAIQQALARHSGNLSEAGRQLGIGRTTLYRKLKQFGLR